MKVLEVSKSSYYPAFHRLCKEVAAARVEANDNVLFLKPLDRYFQKLNLADEFPQLVELFKPIMHVVLLVWKHSHHYNTPGRIVVLVREICNDLIMQSQKFVVGEEIFQVEPPEAVEKLKTTLKVCGTFKSYYFDYKSKTRTRGGSRTARCSRAWTRSWSAATTSWTSRRRCCSSTSWSAWRSEAPRGRR